MVYPHRRRRRFVGTGLYDYYGFICRPPSYHARVTASLRA